MKKPCLGCGFDLHRTAITDQQYIDTITKLPLCLSCARTDLFYGNMAKAAVMQIEKRQQEQEVRAQEGWLVKVIRWLQEN